MFKIYKAAYHVSFIGDCNNIYVPNKETNESLQFYEYKGKYK